MSEQNILELFVSLATLIKKEFETQRFDIDKLTETVAAQEKEMKSLRSEFSELSEDYEGDFTTRVIKAMRSDNGEDYISHAVGVALREKCICTEDMMTDHVDSAFEEHEEGHHAGGEKPATEDRVEDMIEEALHAHTKADHTDLTLDKETVQEIFKDMVTEWHDDRTYCREAQVKEITASSIAKHEEYLHNDNKQADDATIQVNETQLQNMVFNELQCGLEGSGRICDIVQQFVSDNLQIILPDHARDQLDKLLPNSLRFNENVNEMIKDHMEDHRRMDHDVEATGKVVSRVLLRMQEMLRQTISAEKEKDEVKNNG